jgi:hypothetical protein
MAKLKGQALTNRFCDRMAWSQGDNAARANALNALNEALQALAQLGSLDYLKVRASLTLANGFDFVDVSALSPTIDISKQATIALPGGRKGQLTFLDEDKFLVAPMYEYGAWNTDRPSYWTWSMGAAAVPRVVFDRLNSTGGNLTFPFTYQQIEATLDDTTGTQALLPEGYELTLLLPFAECEEKRKLGYDGWKELHTVLWGDSEKGDAGRLGRFLDQHGAGKEDAKPDAEQLRRAQSAQMSEGT